MRRDSPPPILLAPSAGSVVRRTDPKCADANGEPASKQTIGLRHRRHITIGDITYIGRESNQLEGRAAGPPPTTREASKVVDRVCAEARCPQVIADVFSVDLIRLRRLHLIDHQHLYSPCLRHQLEPKLFL